MIQMIQISVIYIWIQCGLSVCVGGGGGGEVVSVFPYGVLCGLFWWDCALRVYDSHI